MPLVASCTAGSTYTTLQTYTDTFPSLDVPACESTETAQEQSGASEREEVCKGGLLAAAEEHQGPTATVHVGKGNQFQYDSSSLHTAMLYPKAQSSAH